MYRKEQLEYFLQMNAQGHVPKFEEGDVDIFFLDDGIHNGPGCTICGWSQCWHCHGPEDIPPCPGPPRGDADAV